MQLFLNYCIHHLLSSRHVNKVAATSLKNGGKRTHWIARGEHYNTCKHLAGARSNKSKVGTIRFNFIQFKPIKMP